MHPFILRVLLLCTLLCLPLAVAEEATRLEPISTSPFSDNIGHYQAFIDSKDYPRYDEAQCIEIGDNILLMQRNNGGWSSNWDPLRILSEEEIQTFLQDKKKADTTLDNRSSYTHMIYLAEVYERTGEERFKEGAIKGLEFILEAQYDNGGWPHCYPRESGYVRYITFMDDVMAGTLSALLKLCKEDSPYSFLDEPVRERLRSVSKALGDQSCAGVVKVPLRERVREAWERGHKCLLDLQVRVDGVPTVWTGQYHHETLEPETGRSYELPGLISTESVTVVRYLMWEAPQTEETVYAIESAMRWFEKSQINGLRIERIKHEPIKYPFRTSRVDVIAVPDPDAPPIWARFYEIDTNRPFMANRDGTKVYALEDLEHERRSGYGWYNTGPSLLLDEEYPRWKAMQQEKESEAAS